MSANSSVWAVKCLKGANKYRLLLDCAQRYEIMVMAWNQRGHNDFNESSVLSVLTEEGKDTDFIGIHH